MRHLAELMLRLMLAPVLLVQALYVGLRAQRLPEAAGARTGQCQGPDCGPNDSLGAPLRLLIVGDSSAAGVGAAEQGQALAGQLSLALGAHRSVDWTLFAKTGATTRSTLRRLHTLSPSRYDIAVVALGVNDTTRGASAAAWTRRMTQLFDRLHHTYGAQHIYISQLPPMGRFPLLPQPLRWVLGRHAARLDRSLAQLCHIHPQAQYVVIDMEMDTTLMASDGFHPGPQVYTIWAQILADQMRADGAV